LWQSHASSQFLWAYRDTIGAAPGLQVGKESEELLNAYLLEKAAYELLYELNNRPAWLHIPMNGILAL
jgi:maltose alpha-D-glucosyltransferase/alpha-amylase